MSLTEKISRWMQNIIHISSYRQQTDDRLSILTDEVRDIRNNQFERDFCRLMNDDGKLKDLNSKMSIIPVVWGDESRLEISDKAAVFACFFNTNSGSIRVGDYSYAGSGASILAGSHDPELTGFLRRDADYKEGFDIEIGRGVWIGSNAAILGPCVIEDDAVVAAGAVVTPGTHIKKGELYAGVPAKKIKDLTLIENLESFPGKLAEVTQRESGILFYSGWSEKKIIERYGKAYLGHWIEDNKAVIYTSKKEICLVFIGEADIHNEADICIENNKQVSIGFGTDPIKAELVTGSDDGLTRVVIETKSKAFVSVESQEKEHTDGTDKC